MLIQRIFFNNYLLMLPIISWCAAQIIKTVIDRVVTGSFSAERLFGSGGMPSSHSAFVCALFVGAGKKCGLSSPEFAITLCLAAVVMYDAMGVRLETGRQARLLNKIVEDLKENLNDFTDAKLKELVGHTPLQVLSGALLGIIIAIAIPVF